MIWKSTLYDFDTCKEFAEVFRLSRDDLILSNAYIYEPYFGCMENLNCYMIFQKKHGAGEPTDVMVDAILAGATKASCKWVVVIGGDTVIDIAKVLVVFDNEGMNDLHNKVLDLEKKQELIIIPTTCDMNNEATNISIITRTCVGARLGLVSPVMYADYAALIPQLLEDLPLKMFAASSIDALIHAVESVLSLEVTPYIKFFGYKVIKMIIWGYQTIARKGPESRFSLLNDFLLASSYVGLVFDTADCAAVHATSCPLGGKYHMARSENNYAVFTGVLKNYMELRRDRGIVILNQYLADLLGRVPNVVYDKLERLLDQILPKRPLHEYGMTREDLPVFTHNVVIERGRLMANNFVLLDKARVLKIYQELF